MPRSAAPRFPSSFLYLFPYFFPYLFSIFPQALDPSEALSASEARAVEDVIRCRCALVVCCQRLVAEVVSDWQHTMPAEHQLQLLGVLKVRLHPTRSNARFPFFFLGVCVSVCSCLLVFKVD